MTLQADVDLHRASKLYRALFNWRACQVNAPNHLNLNMPFNGEDKLTFTRLLPEASAFPISSSSLGAWQLKFRAGATRVNIFAVQKPKPAKSFSLRCLASDSAQPQETLKPRWSTSQRLKRDSYPQKKPTRPAAQLGLPGQSPKLRGCRATPLSGPQNTCNSGFARMGLHSCSSASLQHYKYERAAASDKPPCTLPENYKGAANEIRLCGLKFGPKNGAVSRPQKWGREMDPASL